MLHVGIFYGDEESSCATNPSNAFVRAAKWRRLICPWGWSSGTSSGASLLVPGSRLFGLVGAPSFTVCVCSLPSQG